MLGSGCYTLRLDGDGANRTVDTLEQVRVMNMALPDTKAANPTSCFRQTFLFGCGGLRILRRVQCDDKIDS